MDEIVWSKKYLARVPENLYRPIDYILAMPSKKLRPQLVAMAYTLFQKPDKKMRLAQWVVEAFHNFTLMHDDIMDNAPMRRGLPTVHTKWNVNTAILSGDLLMIQTFQKFFQLPEKYWKHVHAFNACAVAVCEGQQFDMDFETKKSVSEKEYLYMIELKTAVLLGFCCEFGALLADAPKKDCTQLKKIGTTLGISFQLMDDWLDVYGSAHFGKKIGGDIEAGKKTILHITAQQNANAAQRAQLEKAMTLHGRKKVEAVLKLYDELGVKENVLQQIKRYTARGKKMVEQLSIPAHRKQNWLQLFSDLEIRVK